MYVKSVFFLVLLVVENVAASPVVNFNPDWNKLFTGESINMTCDVEGAVTYHWFKDGYQIHSGKTFTLSSAQTSNSGSYQCQTSTGDRSDSVKLDIHNSYVILQVSPHVYEGDNLTLRCHHHPGYLSWQTIFYKNNAIIKGWGSEDELLIENVDMTSSSKYKCTKQVNHHLLYYQHSDETSILVQEVFSDPTIKPSPHAVTEGDHLTLTCDTRLSPLRQTTQLQFSFYKDEENIQKFSSFNKYEITSTKLKDSGDYKCEVRMASCRMKKMSTTLTIQVKKKSEHELFNQFEKEVTTKPETSHFTTVVSVTFLILVLVLIVTALIFLYRGKYLQPVNNQESPEVLESEEPEDITENIYTELDANNKWQRVVPQLEVIPYPLDKLLTSLGSNRWDSHQSRDSSQNPHKTSYKLKTKNDFIVC